MVKLNNKQLQVVEDLENNLLVLASAGTGKTATLTRRIVNIIDSKRANPNEILCLSFTNKACKEMADRIKGELGLKSRKIQVTTFHGWCYDLIIRESKKQANAFADLIIFDEDDCKEIIKKAKLFLPEFNDKAFQVDKLQRFINLVKEELARLKTLKRDDQDLDEIIQYLFKNKEEDMEFICKNGWKKSEKIEEAFLYKGADLILVYTELLKENNGLDFNDLILLTLDILDKKDLVDKLQNTYKYINIDEVQDTSVTEYYIIEKMFGENKVLLSGDIFQTIYQWRGSLPDAIIKHFRNKYEAIDVVFNTNYRATQNLANLSQGYLYKAFPYKTAEIYKDKLEIKSPLLGEKTLVKATKTIKDEAEFIYNKIKRRNKDLGNTCVLTRDNYYNENLSKALEKLQKSDDRFEFTLIDEFRFFRRQEVKDVLAFMKVMINKYDEISLLRIIEKFSDNISRKVLDEIQSTSYKEIGIILTDFIDPLIREKRDPFSALVSELEKDNVIIFDVETTGLETSKDEIIQIAAIRIDKDGNEIERFVKFIQNTKSVGRSQNIHGFSDEFLKNKGQNKKKVLEDFLKFSENSVVVGHNVGFDINILNSELSRLNLEEPSFKTIYDTLEIYRRFYPKEKNHKLEYLCKRFKTKHRPTHDALDDILATGELLILGVKNDIMPGAYERKIKISKYIDMFSDISSKLEDLFYEAQFSRPAKIVQAIVLKFNINNIYSEERVENLRKFYFLLEEIDDKNKNNKDSLLEILKITSLSNGEVELLMLKDRNKTKIPIITVHQAKGLEFDTVFLAGVQENTFPSYRSIKENDLEEEKRTFYVAITRARKKMYITSNSQGRFGNYNEKSRFIKLLPEEHLEYKTSYEKYKI